ncbi:hypothetical protein, partial [Desulfosarcina sp.]|uniref:hypothetical protein n=1 Tax=Desulfosarcina sp. TaxID=2027861 RepID=UPI003564CBCF
MNAHIKKQSRYVWLWLVLFSLIFPLSSATAKKEWNKKSTVKVMTQNLYLGADIFRVVEAAFILDDEGNLIPNPNPTAVPLAVFDVFTTMLDTDFPERAEAIAGEIAKYKPNVIGLQEASTYY